MEQICAIVGVKVGFPHFEEIHICGVDVGNAQSVTFALALTGWHAEGYGRNPPVTLSALFLHFCEKIAGQ